MTTAAEAAVREYFDAMNDGDTSVVDDLFAEDFETLRQGPDHEPEGRDWVREHYDEVLAAFPDLSFELKEVLTDGEWIVVRAWVRGTHDGDAPFLGIEPAGQSFAVQAHYQFRVEDGEITAMGWTIRLGVLLEQLGAELVRPGG